MKVNCLHYQYSVLRAGEGWEALNLRAKGWGRMSLGH